ncbi:MAG: S8 family serine peptidase [Synechococcus sp. SB0668_bin_15]|nr:S8 family serine peptidase [Synechococcus sp. SB0668_bin_15]MYC49555.1 S8 family serine peptidase [Synechococcus sp. SB0662_bin_14]
MTLSPLQKFSRTALVLPLILLASCGGSDDSDSATARCLKTHSGDCLTEPELANRARQLTTAIRKNLRSSPGGAQNWARDAVNAYEGYAHVHLMRGGTAGASPGAGIHIGILDTGIDLKHPDFAGMGTGSRQLQEGAKREPLFSESHGTAVASTAVGFNSGIAWGADMTMFSAKNPDPGRGDYVPLTADLYQAALNENLDILNMSLGYGPGQIDRRSFSGNVGAISSTWTEAQVRDFYGSNILNVWEQPDASEKTILVWAAGNNHGRNRFNAHSPSLDAGAVRFIPELQGHWVTVVATDRSGNIAGFSNRCGIAAQWCIAAPGERVRVAAYEPSGLNTNAYQEQNGTSFAAPMVSGGLAVMKQLFRGQLSNTQLVSRLFATAKKSGVHGNSAVYGQGLMDLGAATNPWGTPAFMGAGSSLGNSDGAGMATSFVSLGSALGDSLPQSLHQQEIAAFDGLGAPFWLEASNFTVPSDGASVATRLNRFLAPPQRPAIPENWQFDFQEKATATETGHLALTHGASRFTVAGPQGTAATLFHKPQDLEGLTLSWTPTSLPAFTMEAGYLNENQSLLGSRGSGAFGQFSGQTLFLGAGLDAAFGDWQLAAEGEIGQVNPSLSHSQFIDAISPLSTSAFRLAASRPFVKGSTLRFSLSAPLRVHSGAASLSLPTGRTQGGTVVGTTLSAPLVPSGRQLDLSAQLDLPLAGGDLSLGATRSTQPRHQQSAAPEWTFFTGYRATW